MSIKKLTLEEQIELHMKQVLKSKPLFESVKVCNSIEKVNGLMVVDPLRCGSIFYGN